MLKLLHRLNLPSRDSYFTRRQIRFLCELSAEQFPGQEVWKRVKYPGARTLPVHLMAMPERFPEELCAPVEGLHNAMLGDGVMHGYTQTSYQQDHRQGHLWLVTFGLGRYVPIGQSVFLAEKRRADDSLGGGFVSRWWLVHTWIMPAYRNQKIFRSSIEYFEAWHPNFDIREATPPLKKAFKDYPEHLHECDKPLRWH